MVLDEAIRYFGFDVIGFGGFGFRVSKALVSSLNVFINIVNRAKLDGYL